MAVTTSRFPEILPQVLVTEYQRLAVKALGKIRNEAQANIVRRMINAYIAGLSTEEAEAMQGVIARIRSDQEIGA